jgi:hypothetical protein
MGRKAKESSVKKPASGKPSETPSKSERYAGQPVREALWRAYNYRIKASQADWIRAGKPAPGSFLSRHPLAQEAVEIEGWLFPEMRFGDKRKRRAAVFAEMLSQAGFPYDLIDLTKRVMEKPEKGAPPRKRSLAIQALEAKLTDENFSWMRFALKHCDCAKPKHDIYCKEAIRQAAMDLQRLLKKFQLLTEVWPEVRPRRTVKV